jgi:hypothetical protein
MESGKKWLRRAVDSPLVLTLVIFLLALGPRVLDLRVFMGPDEPTWLTRSADFAQALASGDLERTYQSGHPGITLLWVETLGAWFRYGIQWLVGSADWDDVISADKTMVVLGSRRQVVAIVNVALVAFAALLTRQIFGSRVAWLAGFLLAFDPFLLTESRVLRTEGLLAGFSTLALLSLLLYLKEPRVRYSALAGALTGLALLSKVSAAALLPVGALVVGGVPLFDTTHEVKGRWRAAIPALVAWGGTLLLTVFALWPALWVAPEAVARQAFGWIAFRAIEGQAGGIGSFFLGTSRDFEDLGSLFYPVVLLFRTGPWVWLGLGLLAALIWRAAGWSRRDKVSLGIMLFYLVVYLVLISRSVLKFDRYIIPMLPTLDLMAAVGLVIAWQWLIGHLSRLRQFGWSMASLVLVSLVVMAWPHHPYYYTYWNPLLGGMRQAALVLPVGVGNEGVDQVAAYLDALPNAESLKLASAHSERIRPLFKGETIPITNLNGEWYLADYTFIYISQLQRGRHNPEIIKYLERKPLDFSFALFGVDYGWLYRGPGAQYFGGDTKLEGCATLHAYDLSETELRAGQTLTTTVYFRNEGQGTSDRFYVRLVDADGYVWAQDSVRPYPGYEDAFRTRGAVVEGKATLALPVGMPPGQYVLKMGYEDIERGRPIGEFVLPSDGDDVVVKVPSVFPALAEIQTFIPIDFVLRDELSLRGYELSSERFTPGESVWLTLYWQALTDVSHDFVISLQLLDQAGSEVAYWLGRPVRSSYSTDQWQSQQMVQDPWRLDLPTEISPGEYRLQVSLFDAETQTEVGEANLTEITVADRGLSFEIPEMQRVLDVDLGAQVRLLGYDLYAKPIMGGGRLQVILYWQAREQMDKSYKVFVHLLSPEGEVVAQHDGLPADGEIPTTDWASGEVVSDWHPLEFQGLPTGEYRLVAGMYDSATGERLFTASGEDTTILLETLALD